jgi:hypothetical protein
MRSAEKISFLTPNPPSAGEERDSDKRTMGLGVTSQPEGSRHQSRRSRGRTRIEIEGKITLQGPYPRQTGDLARPLCPRQHTKLGRSQMTEMGQHRTSPRTRGATANGIELLAEHFGLTLLEHAENGVNVPATAFLFLMSFENALRLVVRAKHRVRSRTVPSDG